VRRLRRYGPLLIAWVLAIATLYAASMGSYTAWPWVLGGTTVVVGILAAVAFIGA
jgi:hypothetical protein